MKKTALMGLVAGVLLSGAALAETAPSPAAGTTATTAAPAPTTPAATGEIKTEASGGTAESQATQTTPSAKTDGAAKSGKLPPLKSTARDAITGKPVKDRIPRKTDSSLSDQVRDKVRSKFNN